MADEVYNPSTDNFEPSSETPKVNPATGISNFTQPREVTASKLAKQKQEDWRAAVEAESRKAFEKAVMEKYKKKQTSKPKKVPKETKYILESERGKKTTSKSTFKPMRTAAGSFFLGRGMGKRTPIKDRLKVLRLQNMLEKKRLQNEIARLKLQKKVDILRKKGILKEVVSAPVMRLPQQIYPAYSTPEIQNDIDSAFNADMNHVDGNLFGNENYYDENYYDEDFFSNEFDNDPAIHLGLKIKAGISPLLW